jgi:hypothetical protein
MRSERRVDVLGVAVDDCGGISVITCDRALTQSIFSAERGGAGASA